MDKIDSVRRSANMARIRSKNTKPEMVVRRLVHALGYRFRLHRKDLPGKPDLVFPSRRKVIFVHGCFWHQHHDPTCKDARLPKSRLDYWIPKLERNRDRDEVAFDALHRDGWDVLVLWECETIPPDDLKLRLQEFLGEPGKRLSRIEPPVQRCSVQ